MTQWEATVEALIGGDGEPKVREEPEIPEDDPDEGPLPGGEPGEDCSF